MAFLRRFPQLVVASCCTLLLSACSTVDYFAHLAKGPFRGTALVHPADAQRLGLSDGARAQIRNGERAIDVQVELSDAMMPGVVSLPHGWGHNLPGARLNVASQRPGANLNAVLDENLRDPLSGNAVLSGVAVELRPA